MNITGNARAALLAMASASILSFIDNFVAMTAEEAGLWQFQVTRTVMACAVIFIAARMMKFSLRPKNMRNFMLRSLAVSGGLMIYFAALGTVSVPQAAAGLFSAPIFVLIFSAWFFKKPVGLLSILAMCGGFAGALLLLRPDPAALSPATLTPLAAGALYGLGMVLTRHLTSEEKALALTNGVILTMGAASLMFLLVFTFIAPGGEGFLTQGWEWAGPRFYWLTLMQALGAVIAVTLIAEAYRTGEPGYVAMFEYSFLIFASLWAFLLHGDVTDTLAVAGILLIIISGAVISLPRRKG